MQFREKNKTPMQVDANPLQVKEENYAEPFEVMMVNATDGSTKKGSNASSSKDVALIKADYPDDEENLVDFLQRCKISHSRIMLCPRCIAMFDEEIALKFDGYRPRKFDPRRLPNGKNTLRFVYHDVGAPHTIDEFCKVFTQQGQKTYKPATNILKDIWVKPTRQRGGGQPKWTKINPKMALPSRAKAKATSNMVHVPEGYKGENPMTRTQWRRHQRNKKAQRGASVLKTLTQPPAGKGFEKMANKRSLIEIPLYNNPRGGKTSCTSTILDVERKGEKLASSLDHEMVESNFDDDFDILLGFT